jgi:hypothetical protein
LPQPGSLPPPREAPAPSSSMAGGYVLSGRLRLIRFGRFLLRPSSPTSARAPPKRLANMGPTGEAAEPGPCDDRCEPGPGRFGPAAGWRPRQGERCRRPGSTHRKLRLAGRWHLTRFVRFLATSKRASRSKSGAGGVARSCRKPRVTLFSPKSPGSLLLEACRLRLARTPAPHPFWMISWDRREF